MSAVNVLVKREAAYIMVDGATYDPETGIVGAILKKCHIVKGGHTAVASIGPCSFSSFIAEMCGDEFDSFDNLISGIEAVLPSWFDFFMGPMNDGDDCVGEITFGGWSERENRPAVYSARYCKPGMTDQFAEMSQRTGVAAKPFVLSEVVFSGTPSPDFDLLQATGWVKPSSVEEIDPVNGLLHILEVQRQNKGGRYKFHLVGCHALLTTIAKNGITQTVAHVWPEDVVGEVITPEPVNWTEWRAKHKRLPPALAGLSKLQRDRLAKKARKGTFKAA